MTVAGAKVRYVRELVWTVKVFMWGLENSPGGDGVAGCIRGNCTSCRRDCSCGSTCGRACAVIGEMVPVSHGRRVLLPVGTRGGLGGLGGVHCGYGGLRAGYVGGLTVCSASWLDDPPIGSPIGVGWCVGDVAGGKMCIARSRRDDFDVAGGIIF